jgi:acyl-CoA thioesterase-1
VIVVVLATLATLLGSTGATGADAERCALFSTQSQVRERLVSGEGRPITVIGDSYAVGLGLRDAARSWPARLPGRVQVYGFSGSGFSSGASSCGRVWYAARAPHALRARADLVVVEGGLNDYDQPVGDVRAGFRMLLRTLHGRDVLVVGPPLAPSRVAGARRVDSVLHEEADRAGARYLSMTGGTFGYLEDGLHLTPAGHRAFGDVVAAALER